MYNSVSFYGTGENYYNKTQILWANMFPVINLFFAVLWIFLAIYGLRMRLVTDWVENKATIVTQENYYGDFGLLV